MEFKAFNYVLKVASEKNFTKAAAKLYISQPSLSQYINSVEDELGVKLFDRSASPIKLTPAGEIYVNYAKQILSSYGQMLSEISKINHSITGMLRIGSSNFRSSCIMPKIISGFRKLYPMVDIRLNESDRVIGETMVENNEVDFAVVTSPVKNEDRFDKYYICNEEIYLLLPPSHPYNKNYKREDEFSPPTIKLAEMENEHFVFLTKNQKMHDLALSLCERSGFNPKISIETPLMSTAYQLSMAGVGIAFIPSTFPDNFKSAETSFFYRIYPYFPNRDVFMIKKKKDTPSVIKQCFSDFLSDYQY